MYTIMHEAVATAGPATLLDVSAAGGESQDGQVCLLSHAGKKYIYIYIYTERERDIEI